MLIADAYNPSIYHHISFHHLVHNNNWIAGFSSLKSYTYESILSNKSPNMHEILSGSKVISI